MNAYEFNQRMFRLLIASIILLFISTPFKVSALNTNISFYAPNTTWNGQVGMWQTNSSDIYIRFNITDTDIANQIPDNVAVIVQECFWNLTGLNIWTCYMGQNQIDTWIYLENLGTWQQTFLNPFNESLQNNIINKGYELNTMKLYASIYSGYSSTNFGTIISYDEILYNKSSQLTQTALITPTPTPNYTSVPIVMPTVTTAPNTSNQSKYNYSTNESVAWTNYSNQTVSGYNTTIYSIFQTLDYPFSSLRTGIQYINSSFNNTSYNISYSFLNTTVPIIISSIPDKIKALITTYLIMLVILIILGRD